MAFSHSFPSMTFAVMIVGQLVERGVGIVMWFKELEDFIRFVLDFEPWLVVVVWYYSTHQ